MADEADGYLEEEAKKRCRRAIDSIGRLPSSIPDSCKRTLLRLARAELSFLSRRTSSSSTAPLRYVTISLFKFTGESISRGLLSATLAS